MLRLPWSWLFAQLLLGQFLKKIINWLAGDTLDPLTIMG